jgi:hypothetical protein
MFTCCTKISSVINFDLFWKQVFSYNKLESLLKHPSLSFACKLSSLARADSTVVEHLLRRPKVEGWLLAPETSKEKFPQIGVMYVATMYGVIYGAPLG